MVGGKKIRVGVVAPPAARLKLPAYAKGLMDHRRRGFHPLRVDVLYGFDWREAINVALRERRMLVQSGAVARVYGDAWERDVGRPMLAVKPGDYQPGLLSFSAVAGCAVRVIDDCEALADYDFCDVDKRVTRWGWFYFLLGEVSVFAASVTFCESGGAETDAADFAFGHRHFDPALRRFVMPPWWPDTPEIRKARERRNNTWWRISIEQHAGTGSG